LKSARVLALATILSVAVATGFAFVGDATAVPPLHTTVVEVLARADADAVGVSMLTRDNTGATMSSYVQGLEPNSLYTVWWFVFNNPRNCTGPCDAPDLVPTNGAVQWATSFLTDSTGHASFGARIDRGNPALGFVQSGHPRGLASVKKAEIHFGVVNHGVPGVDFPLANIPLEATTPGSPLQAVAIHLAK
jgi:hypothetical protein